MTNDKLRKITKIDGKPMSREELLTLDKNVLIDKILSLEKYKSVMKNTIRIKLWEN